MRILKTLMSAVLGAVISTGAASALEIKLGHVGEPGSLFDQVSQEFAKRANAKLGTKAKVVVYGSSQLGGDTEMMKKLKLGTIDLSMPSTVMSTLSPEFALFEMPYLVKDREHAARIREAIVKPTLYPIAEKKGYHILAMWESGFRHVTNNKHPISKPDDLQGIKLRVPQGVWRVKMFQAYGSTPSPLAFSEVFVALQTGVMDGQENPLAQIYPARFQEVQKFLSMTGHVYSPVYLTSGRSWEGMPADVRKAIEEAAKEMEPVSLELSAKLDDELLGKMKEAGIKVNQVDKTAFIKASKTIYDEFAKEVPGGKAMIDKALELGQGS